MFIVIIDMDQPGIRRFVGIDSGDEFSLAKFDSMDDVHKLMKGHPLGAFEWIVIDTDTYETFIR